MSQVTNLLHLQPGTNTRLTNGDTAEVMSNPMDGVWVSCRYLSTPADPNLEGTEELIFAQDIAEVIESP